MSVSANVQKHEWVPEGYTEYFIVIFYKGVEWGVRKRYSDFVKFDDYLRSQGYKLTCKLTGKNFWNRYDPTLITRRVGELQTYLNHLLSSTMTDNNLIKEFLEVDENMLKQAKLMSVKAPEKETAFTDRLDNIVRETRKSVLPISRRERSTNMHSAAYRTSRQVSHAISMSGRTPTSPSIDRASSSSSREVSTDQSVKSKSTSVGGEGDGLNYAGGTGPMIQSHIGESKTCTRESPSGSFSEQLVVTGNGSVARRDAAYSRERKECASIGTPPANMTPVNRSISGGGERGHFSFYGSGGSALEAALAIEDARRKDKFGVHIEKMWAKEVPNMGKILRTKKSKKRLPVALTEEMEKSEGVSRLSQIFEGGKQLKKKPETKKTSLTSGGDDQKNSVPQSPMSALSTPSGEAGDSDDEGLQEDIIFRNDQNSWITDLLSAPVGVDEFLQLMDECVLNMGLDIPLGHALDPIASDSAVAFPEVLWSIESLQSRGLVVPLPPSQKNSPLPTRPEGGTPDSQRGKNSNISSPASPSNGTGLRRMKPDGKIAPLLSRANSVI
jgi:hypothetical protein